MKNPIIVDIFYFTIIFILSIIIINHYDTVITNNEIKYEILNNKYKRLQDEYKNHIKDCAFISLDSIKKISKNGRIITLYFPTELHKIKYYKYGIY